LESTVILTSLFVESWVSKLVNEVGASPLEGKFCAIDFWFLVCGSFVARGAKGEEEFPSIGWKVPMKSLDCQTKRKMMYKLSGSKIINKLYLVIMVF
jgi:hypothetical protein